MSFVNPQNSSRPNDKSSPYGEVISKINNDGVCPFCPENLKLYHKNPILKEGDFWLVTENMYPYKNAKYHFLLIYKKHIEDIAGIETEGWLELKNILNNINTDYEIKGGSFFFRFGETKYTGATVSHLHSHLISRNLDSDSDEPILARLG